MGDDDDVRLLDQLDGGVRDLTTQGTDPGTERRVGERDRPIQVQQGRGVTYEGQRVAVCGARLAP